MTPATPSFFNDQHKLSLQDAKRTSVAGIFLEK
jgi:hypothetical protein